MSTVLLGEIKSIFNRAFFLHTQVMDYEFMI